MAVRLDNNPWVSSDGLTHTDLNNTLSVFTQTITLVCKNHIRTLFDRVGVYSNDTTDLWGEAYIDSNGRNDSVDTGNTTAVFDTDKYVGLDNTTNDYTTHDPDSIDNPENAFDVSDATSATKNQYVSSIQTHNLGKVFGSEKYVSNIKIIASASCSDNNSMGIYIKLQTYDGSTWSDEATLDSDSDNNFVSVSYDNTYELNETVQGIRVQIQTASGSAVDHTAVWSTIYIFEPVPVEIEHTIPTGTFNSTIDSAIGTFIAEDWEDGANVQFKLTNTGGDDSGWLDTNTYETFTAFTAEPDTLIVKLIPKTTSPTSGYPSIKGFALRCN